MIENSESIDLLICRFLQGEASEDEVKKLEAWISEKKENRNTYREWAELWGRTELANPDFSKNQNVAWARLSSEVDDLAGAQKKSRKLNVYGLLRIAAMLVVAVGLTWMASHRIYNSAPLEGDKTVVFTPLGSRTHVILPDSSEAWLNAGSKLSYQGNFSHKSRQVYLDGEAFFEVVPDARRMFEVITSDVTVRVFGTSFNVKSYAEEGTIETTLLEGKISLIRNAEKPGRKQKELYLEPQQKATFIKKEGRIALSDVLEEKDEPAEQILKSGNILIFNQVDVEEVSSWKTGQLVINSESLIDLSTELARKYDVKFVFEDEGLKKFKFTGILEDESIEQVLYAMQLTAPIHYRIEGKEVYIKVLPGVIIDNK